VSLFGLDLDLTQLKSLFGLSEAAAKAMADGARDLSAMGHAKIVELAAQRLHSRRKMFLDAVTMSMVDGVWVIQLDAKMEWIDSGLPPHDMLEALLRSPKAKISKEGFRYLVVPFQHNKLPQNTPASSQPMVDQVKAYMKSKSIPWGKVERDEQGRPLLGKLHGFSLEHTPLKSGHGPGQGWGPVGDVRQGPNHRQIVGGGPGGGGIPFLRGVAVYQNPLGPRAPRGVKEVAEPHHGVQRSVMTFRVASEKHKGQGRWHHPGLHKVAILDDTFEWMKNTLENEIGPAILDRINASI
jgi:hypothetical protein